MKRFPFIVAFLMTTVVFLSVAAAADEGFKGAKARDFDPFHTNLVNASWVGGIGCPTDARIQTFDAAGNPTVVGSYMDAACSPANGGGDSRDKNNEGLLMAKTGPTANDAAAVADLQGVKGIELTELGYDLRKPDADVTLGARGSHCGAGAPRFDITLQNSVGSHGNFFFLGCRSPLATTQVTGAGFVRLRWGGGGAPVMAFTPFGVLVDITGQAAKSISIVFDEGQDIAPDNFGLAVLDNIDVNGDLVGRGNADVN